MEIYLQQISLYDCLERWCIFNTTYWAWNQHTTKHLPSKPRATLCVFLHAKIEITSSKGVHCTRWENLRTCRSAFLLQLQIASAVVT